MKSITKKIFRYFRRDFSFDDAEDSTQQTFLQLWGWLPRADSVRSGGALIYSIARNVRADRYRNTAFMLETAAIYGICVYCKGADFMSIMQELWYGNINPNEKREVTDDGKELVELMARHQECLMSKLKEKELDAFKKYVECCEEYTSLVECQAFEIGFKLAVKLLTE